MLMSLILQELAQQQIGAKVVADRLLNALLVLLLRQLAEQEDLGWLSGLSDDRLSPVLSAIHQDPAHPWSVTKLAKVANLSPSAFSRRFKAVLGQGPMDYLSRWRIDIASQQLEQTQNSVMAIGLDLGFNSSDVFIRNFKRWKGDTPDGYRRRMKLITK